MSRKPKRAKVRKAWRKPVRVKPTGEHPRKPTKDEQIKRLQIAYEGMEKMRNEANARATSLCDERNSLAEELQNARARIRDLTAESNRQLGYIQRVQEDNMASGAWRQTGQTTSSSAPGNEHVVYNSEHTRVPVYFGPIADRARRHLDSVRQMDASRGYSTDQNGGYGRYGQ